MLCYVHRSLIEAVGFRSNCSIEDKSETHVAILAWRHAKLHVSVLYVGLTEVEHGLLHEMASHRGEGSVRSHNQVRLSVHRFVSARSVNEYQFLKISRRL
jgi:hypothetical protein